MPLIKYILIIFIFLTQYSCKLNKINNVHGVGNLLEKTKLIKINSSNKNDIIRIFGRSILVDNIENKISYFEVRETKNNFGKKINKLSSYVEIEFDKNNIVKNINIFDTSKNNDLKFTNTITKTTGVKDTFLSNLLNSTRKRMEKAREKFK